MCSFIVYTWFGVLPSGPAPLVVACTQPLCYHVFWYLYLHAWYICMIHTHTHTHTHCHTHAHTHKDTHTHITHTHTHTVTNTHPPTKTHTHITHTHTHNIYRRARTHAHTQRERETHTQPHTHRHLSTCPAPQANLLAEEKDACQYSKALCDDFPKVYWPSIFIYNWPSTDLVYFYHRLCAP
jgi:hypothetical protein